jgi:hypothetical protein
MIADERAIRRVIRPNGRHVGFNSDEELHSSM